MFRPVRHCSYSTFWPCSPSHQRRAHVSGLRLKKLFIRISYSHLPGRLIRHQNIRHPEYKGGRACLELKLTVVHYRVLVYLRLEGPRLRLASSR